MSNFALKTNAVLKEKNTGEHGRPGFSEIFDFAVCGGVFCTFAYSRGLFSVNFLHFLPKYRCVPKIGFSADIFIDIYIDIIIDISIDIFTDISIDIFIDIFVDISIDNSIDILTDKEGGRRRRRSGLILKI